MRAAAGGALVALVAMWGIGACGDSTDEKLEAIRLGGSCSLDSQCEGDLVCIFSHCHRACDEDEDCEDGKRCVLGENGQNVCQLDAFTKCDDRTDCIGGQLCAVDGECRDACRDEGDCVAGQRCTPSGQCASSDPSRDQLQPNGDLVPKGMGGASSGGAPSTGGRASGGAGEPDASAGGAASGGAASGGAASGGAAAGGTASGGASGGAASGGAASGGAASGGADAGGNGDFVEPGDVETVDNDTHEKAVLAGTTASIFLPPGDVDWFKIDVPDTGGAHVVEISADHQPGASSFLYARDGVNRAQIAFVRAGGASVGRLFLTVRSGSTVYVELRPDDPNTGDHRIDLRFTLTPESDAHEPNDTKAAAASIPVGVDVRAQCLRAYVTASDQRSDDWYKVSLQAGPATLLIKNDLGDHRMLFFFSGAGSAETLIVQTPNASTSFPLDVPVAGDYYVHVTHGGNTSFQAWATNSRPAYMTDQYVFQVQQ